MFPHGKNAEGSPCAYNPELEKRGGSCAETEEERRAIAAEKEFSENSTRESDRQLELEAYDKAAADADVARQTVQRWVQTPPAEEEELSDREFNRRFVERVEDEEDRRRFFPESEAPADQSVARFEEVLDDKIDSYRADRLQLAMLQLEALNRAESAPPVARQPEIPAYEQDPLGHFEARVEMAETHLIGLARQKAAEDEHQRIQSAVAQHQAQVGAIEQEASKRLPGYDEAARFYVAGRIEDHVAMDVPRQQAEFLVKNLELNNIIFTAMQRGDNPADRIYAAAKARGWRPKPQAAPVRKAVVRRGGIPLPGRRR